MARLIDNRVAVQLDQVVAGLPVVEFMEETPQEMDLMPPPRKSGGGARLDRTFEVFEWFEC